MALTCGSKYATTIGGAIYRTGHTFVLTHGVTSTVTSGSLGFKLSYKQLPCNAAYVDYMITWNLRTQRWRLRSPHGSRQKCVQYGRLLLQLSLQMWTHMLMPLHHQTVGRLFHHSINPTYHIIDIQISNDLPFFQWWYSMWCNGINMWFHICNDNWRSNLPYWTHFCLDPWGDLNCHLWVLRFQIII